VEWLILLAALLAVPVVLLGSAAFVATAALRRANRLVPGRAGGSAPLRWLWSPSFAASLHRRLRFACQVALSVAAPLGRPGARFGWRERLARRRAGVAPDAIAQLARGVLDAAVLLDRQVVAASYLARGFPRAQALASIEPQVRTVEDQARRVQQLAHRRAQLASCASFGGLDLEQQIEAMESALSELSPGAARAGGGNGDRRGDGIRPLRAVTGPLTP
jgi:hypothetical protein